MSETVEFTKKAVKAYLDKCIDHWREEKNKHINTDSMAIHYIDAFQSVRISLFGKLKEKSK